MVSQISLLLLSNPPITQTEAKIIISLSRRLWVLHHSQRAQSWLKPLGIFVIHIKNKFPKCTDGFTAHENISVRWPVQNNTFWQHSSLFTTQRSNNWNSLDILPANFSDELKYEKLFLLME